MSKQAKTKARHSSLEMPDPEVVKKKHDMLSRAKDKIFHFGENRLSTHPEGNLSKKSFTQSTYDLFFKSKQDKNQPIPHDPQESKLQKQNSISSYPIRIEVEDIDSKPITRSRPSSLCTDKEREARGTAALALERPRKKLSFMEPGDVFPLSVERNASGDHPNANSLDVPAGMRRSISFTNGCVPKTPSIDEVELQAQAMRVVRTVGQAFEVCHKLSITAPENRYEQDEQDTLTQDFLSDRLSDITPSKTKPDFAAENDLDDLSLTLDDGVFKDMIPTTNNRFQQIEREIVSTNNSKNNATTNSAPNSDGLGSGTGSSGYSSFPTSGSPLSAQHEIQLLKEQLDQQTQQTQSAFAQLQLTREQLVSEQTARVEAQTRIHQLLVHNRELLDHIAALVSHLHGGEKVGQLQHSDTTLPQELNLKPDHYGMDSIQASNLLQDGLHGLIENRAVASSLPQSPMHPFTPTGVFNFQYPPEAQLLQRLQAMNCYSMPNTFPYPYSPQLSYYQPQMYPQMMLNNNYAVRSSPTRSFPSMYSNNQQNQNECLPSNTSTSTLDSKTQQILKQSQYLLKNYQESCLPEPQSPLHNNFDALKTCYQKQQSNEKPKDVRNSVDRETNFIRPLSQPESLASSTTDMESKLRLNVPATLNRNQVVNQLANVRLVHELQPNAAPITRTTSEKVPNRSELMQAVNRKMWARHTTK